ncbi:MAG: GGDEF domain-containing protein [Fervidobacterium sp.]|nr:GGDEF domain-containing protein [Fervidobacterium sp.]
MKDRIYITEAIIKFNKRGIITQVIYDSNNVFDQKEQIFDVLTEKSKASIKKIIGSLQENNYFLDKLLNFYVDEYPVAFFCSGFLCGDEIVMMLFNDLSQTIAEELIKISNEQTNTFRNLIKKFQQYSKEKDETRFLEEIVKLNNELVNYQREVTKKSLELEMLNKKLEQLAVTDYLTKAYNRRYFFEKIKEEFARAKRFKYTISLVMVDLNNFKKINDTLGHLEGDKILKDFVSIVRRYTREGLDNIFRFGGDEFLILLLNCSYEEAEKILVRISNELKKIQPITGLSYGIVAVDPKDAREELVEYFLKQADEKMYKMKKGSENREENSDE